ncbi:MAG: zf-HC2 domain-containing protein [Elusimicrobia bacterium]|nr:zf-HC2 domain-containing protein [Elusimicrobiota bacterium]
MSCEPEDVLSAYADGELDPARRARVDAHVSGCGSCKTTVRLFARFKEGLRSEAAPEMPASLRRSLEEMVGARDAPTGWLDRLASSNFVWRRAVVAALCACAVLAAALWRGSVFGDVEVPMDLVLAAHDRYALTMPLASQETILARLPVGIAAEIGN